MAIDEMEGNYQVQQHHVDTSRPFSSVKEAVAIFGQRIMLPVQTHTVNPKPVSTIASPNFSQTAQPLSLIGSPSTSLSPIASPNMSQASKLVSPTASPRISQTAKPVSHIGSPSISLGPVASPNRIQTAKLLSPTASPSSIQTAKPVSFIGSPSISRTGSSSSSPWKQHSLVPSSPQGAKDEIMDVLKKLEAEITETKTEVKMLKERESETEAALAMLNAELHKNMSKITKAEADTTGKRATAMAKTVSFKETKDTETRDEERRKELARKIQKKYPSLAQILDSNKKDRDGYFVKITKKKKKPIIPLVGDFFFFKKKESSTEISGPLYTSSSTLYF